MYYAIQDIGIGYIQSITEAADPEQALDFLRRDIGTAVADLPMESVTITELTESQYKQLKRFSDGTDQEAIDLLERFKAAIKEPAGQNPSVVPLDIEDVIHETGSKLR